MELLLRTSKLLIDHHTTRRSAFPDGRMGSNSAAASVEAGKKIVTLTGEVLAKTYQEFIGS